jgi:predicted metalloprotease
VPGRPAGSPPPHGQWNPRWNPAYSGYPPPRPRSRANIGLILVMVFGATAVAIVLAALSFSQEVSSGGIASPAPPVVSGAPGPDGPPPGPPAGAPTAPGSGEGGGPGGTGEPGGGTPAATNPLYRAGALPATGCRGRTVTQGDSTSMERFLHATTDCLDRSWQPTLPRGGATFAAPRRVYWTEPGRSPCGDYPASGAAAFYCALNNTIYIGVVHVQEAAGGMPVKWNVAYARGVAHEYAHHVQEVTGILQWSRDQRVEATDSEQRDAITRRSELQAQCLAGMFMASVRDSFPVSPEQWRIALRDSLGRGDRGGIRDHGTGEHYAEWLRIGFRRKTASACNTWAAPASRVS